jgi:uncharacterized protein with PIN domain
MPGLKCACGVSISYGEIPCKNEWLFISDVDYDSFSGQVDTERIYRAMHSFLRCPTCRRLWVFWGGYQDIAEEFLPVKADANNREIG